MTSDKNIEKTKLTIHTTIEQFARVLHDGVERCESRVGLLVIAKMIAQLVAMLDAMVEVIGVESTNVRDVGVA